ncbi:hypothetical protein O988_00291 [Pseudogymnoascus sp. VKM F-3808]|nr:hypothetical protein O988_00291 [Pseudogymnoascus sp. VKM F-3808]
MATEIKTCQLAIVTDDMGITGAVFTCTRDNALANTIMLAEYEKIARDQEVTTQQPWTFKVKEGDIQCIAHIINIAVQDALKTLKAVPAEQAESYQLELNVRNGFNYYKAADTNYSDMCYLANGSKDCQYYLDEEKRDAKAEANLLQLPTEPDSDDDLYISHSIYQEPEWKRWLVEPRPGPATDILKYWAAKQYQYPIITAIAQDHLAIPATSAPSKQVFSNGADIITKKGNRLSPETLRYLLCLQDWGHILEAEESEAKDADNEGED